MKKKVEETPRDKWFRERKEALLRETGRPVTEENMAKITIHTKWETYR